MREKAMSTVMCMAVIGLAIADAESVKPTRYGVALVGVIWLTCVAVPLAHQRSNEASAQRIVIAAGELSLGILGLH
jgi:hypothetical protein